MLAKWTGELSTFERKQVLFLPRVAFCVAGPESRHRRGFQPSDIVARRPSAPLPVASHLPPPTFFLPPAPPNNTFFYDHINTGKYGTALEQIQTVLKDHENRVGGGKTTSVKKQRLALKQCEANGTESHYEMMCGACKWLFLVSEVAQLSHDSIVAMAIICNGAENPQNS